MTDAHTRDRLALADERKMYTHMGHTHEVSMPQRSDTEIAHMVRMLMRSDLNHEAVVCAARDRMLYLIDRVEKLETALRASGAYVEGQRDRVKLARLLSDHFYVADGQSDAAWDDGMLDWHKEAYLKGADAIASLPLEAQESDGGVEGHAGPGDRLVVHDDAGERAATERFAVVEAGIKPGPSDTPTVREALEDCQSHRASWRNAIEIAGDHALVVPPDIDDKCYWQHELMAFDRVFAALKPEAAPAGEVVWQWSYLGTWYTAEKPTFTDPEGYARSMARSGGGKVRCLYTATLPVEDRP